MRNFILEDLEKSVHLQCCFFNRPPPRQQCPLSTVLFPSTRTLTRTHTHTRNEAEQANWVSSLFMPHVSPLPPLLAFFLFFFKAYSHSVGIRHLKEVFTQCSDRLIKKNCNCTVGRLDSLRMNHNPKKQVAVNDNDANAEVTAKKSALFAGFCF